MKKIILAIAISTSLFAIQPAFAYQYGQQSSGNWNGASTQTNPGGRVYEGGRDTSQKATGNYGGYNDNSSYNTNSNSTYKPSKCLYVGEDAWAEHCKPSNR